MGRDAMDSPTRIESETVVALCESTLENISHPMSGNLVEHWWKLVCEVEGKNGGRQSDRRRQEKKVGAVAGLTSWCQLIWGPPS